MFLMLLWWWLLTEFTPNTVVDLDGIPTEVKAGASCGLSSMTVAGRPDIAVQENWERVRAATNSPGRPFPVERLIVEEVPWITTCRIFALC